MRPRTILSVPILALLLVAIAAPAQAQTASPQQTLNQYVSDLQRSPNDTALREKIIALVQTMHPAPAITEEARRHYIVGKTLSDGAKKPEDFTDAIAEYRSALLAAPWWPEAIRDFALTLEAAERFDEAIAYVKLYMATNPGEERTRAAQDELYKIEARQKLAAKARVEESAAKADAAPPQNSFEHLLKKIDGRRYVYFITASSQYMVLDVIGRFAKFGAINTQGTYVSQLIPDYSFQIIGRVTTVQSPDPSVSGLTWIISEDGESITERFRYNGMNYDNVYHWQR